MHLWHTWKSISKRPATASYSGGLFSFDRSCNVIAEIQKCKCGKERGLLHFLDGHVREIHPDFIRDLL
jgi:hypothetical protein